MHMTEPVIEHRGAFFLAGMLYRARNEHGEIGAMWGGFIPRSVELQPDVPEGRVFYGAERMAGGYGPGVFEYLASLEVDSLDNLPQGMVGWEIPEQTYAVFPISSMDELGHVVDYAHSEWLPKSGKYECADGTMFEYYPKTFSQDGALYYYCAVRERA